MEKQLLKKSGILAIAITFILMGFWFSFSKLSLGIDTSNWTPYAMKKNSVVSEQLIIMCGTSGSGIVFGTTSGAWVGTPTDSTLARVFFNTATGQLEFKPSGTTTSFPFGSVTVAYLDANYATIGSVSAKLDAIGGVGTGNTFNNITLAGVGTVTASINVNGLDISPAEYASVNNATSELQTQINGKQNVLGYTPPADVLGSITTALGYTPPANVPGSITTALGYTPPANVPGSITTALGYTPTNLGNSIELGTETTGNTDNVSEGNTNQYHTVNRVNAIIGSSSVGSRLNEQVVSVADGHHFVYDSASSKWKNATSTASVGFGGITGSPIDNVFFKTKVPESGKILVGIPDTILVSGTTTIQPIGSATVYNYLSQQSETLDSAEADGSQTVFLLHYAGDFGNAATGGITWTATNAVISGVQSKFGTSAALFDGVGDIVTSNSNAKLVPGLHTNWFFSTWFYANTITGNDGIFSNDAGYQTETLAIDVKNSNLEISIGNAFATATTASAWHNIYVSNVGDIQRVFYNGRQFGTHSDAVNLSEGGSGFILGEYAGAGFNFDGYLDETIFAHGMATGTSCLYTENFTPLTSAYSLVTPFGYTSSEIRVQDAQGNILMSLLSPGTATTEKSYTFLPGSVTVFGGTSMSAIGTATPGLAYGVPGKGAATFDAFNVHSVSAIKAGVESLAGKENDQKDKLLKMNSKSWHPKVRDVYLLDAEARAKDNYISKDYATWEVTNKSRYIFGVKMPGTGTVQILDSEKMAIDFKTEKELSWASDLNQPTLIKETQDILESDETITRLGFMVKDPLTPRETIEGEAINLMSVITLTVDAIKAQDKEIGSLTAALENQRIAYGDLAERVKALEAK